MPTGYTAPVQDGKITTLREFALSCSRNFGALILMRDDPADAPIPRKIEPDTKYHDENLASARTILETVPAMTDDECDKAAADAFATAMESHVKYQTNQAQAKQRYEEMLRRVEGWKVPEDITGLKTFMAQQLRESIDFDCRDYSDNEPVRLTAQQWRQRSLEKASRDVAYHSVERAKELQRTEDRNRWLAALWSALPDEQPHPQQAA